MIDNPHEFRVVFWLSVFTKSWFSVFRFQHFQSIWLHSRIIRGNTIPDETLAAIGRLIGAFAEIEDLVTLYICNLAEISQSKAIVLLGRTAITWRIRA